MKIINSEEFIDRSYPFINEDDLNCHAPSRLPLNVKALVYECSHPCKENCPHYNYEADLIAEIGS